MRGGTWAGLTLLLAGVALAAAAAALAQAPGASSSSSSGPGGASASASAGTSSSSSSSSSSATGGGQQQQQQQQQGGGAVIVVAQPPAITNTGVSGTALTTVYGTTESAPVTQVFTPPQEIILSAQPATQVFTPPASSQTVQVVRTVPQSTYQPPRRGGNLPFTGMPTALGLITGTALALSGALLLLRRRDSELDEALARQAAALDALSRR